MPNISFGIRDLDKLMLELNISGGLISVLSTPDSGYEVVSKAFLVANDSYNKLALIAKESESEFKSAVKKFNLGKVENVEIMDVGEAISRIYMQSMSTIAQIFGSQKIEDFQKLFEGREELSKQSLSTLVIESVYDKRQTKIYIDFLDFLMEEMNFQGLSTLLNSFVSQAKHNNNFYIFPLEVDLYPQLEAKLVSNSDIVFRLYSKKSRGNQRVNIIETVKIKNNPHIGFIGVYSVVPREGIVLERIERI